MESGSSDEYRYSYLQVVSQLLWCNIWIDHQQPQPYSASCYQNTTHTLCIYILKSAETVGNFKADKCVFYIGICQDKIMASAKEESRNLKKKNSNKIRIPRQWRSVLPLRWSNSSSFAIMLLKICKLLLEKVHSTVQNRWGIKKGQDQRLNLHTT